MRYAMRVGKALAEDKAALKFVLTSNAKREGYEAVGEPRVREVTDVFDPEVKAWFAEMDCRPMRAQ